MLCVVKADLAQSSKERGAQLKPAFGTGVFSSATKPMSKRPASVLAAEVDGPGTLGEGGDNSVCLKTRGVYYEEAQKRWIARISENGKSIGKSFPVKRYRTEGMSFTDALRLAHEAAVEHRKALEQSRSALQHTRKKDDIIDSSDAAQNRRVKVHRRQ